MKEIKAFVRPSCVETIVGRLEAAGARDLTITQAEAVGPMAETDNYRVRMFGNYLERYSNLAKIEVVCADAEVDRLVGVIHETAGMSKGPEGRLFVSTVDRAINLSSRDEGEKAL